MSPRSPVGFVETLRPGRIGPIELRNRVVLPAMDMNLCSRLPSAWTASASPRSPGTKRSSDSPGWRSDAAPTGKATAPDPVMTIAVPPAARLE